jgi:beta-lactamase class A
VSRFLVAGAVSLAIACASADPAPSLAPTAGSPDVVAPSPTSSSPGQSPTTSALPTAADPWGELEDLLDTSEGRYGVVVDVLGTAESFRYRDTTVFPSASVYKALLAAAVLEQVQRGALTLEQRLTVADDDAEESEPDAGLAPGERVSVREALSAMMGASSNAAAHLLLRTVGHAEVNRRIADWGLSATEIPPPEDGVDPRPPVTTAADMALFFRALIAGGLLSGPAQDELLALLRLPEDLDAVAYTLPDDVGVYTKIGELEDASNVAGWIVTPRGPIVLAIFDADTDPGSARFAIAQIARLLYRRYAG